MPPLPAVPNVLKLQLHWGVEEDTLAETIHYLKYTGGPPTSAQCASMATAIQSSAGTAFAAVTNSAINIGGAVVTDLSSSSGGQGLTTATTAGTRTGNNNPPGTCMLINHQLQRRYRGGKPRSYFPIGSNTDVMTTGFWTSAFVTASLAAWNAFAAALTGDGVGCTITGVVNVSYYAGSRVVINPETERARNVPIPRAVPLVDSFTGSSARNKFGSQRRRNKAQ